VPFAAVLHVVWEVGRSFSPAGLTALWASHPILAAVVCFVVVDGVAYLYHWVGHHTRIGWASHRVHHLGESFDMGLVLRQPWLPVHGLAIVPLTALAGFPFELAAACSAISLAYLAVQHTSRSWALGPLEEVLVSGRAHRHHHLLDGAGANLGAVLSVWDRLVGTRRQPSVDPTACYGVGEPEPIDAVGNQLDGWRDLWSPLARHRHRSRRRRAG
jgi:sterol desaturase/sphingolipid hydroxylase (fatty acid hydroxylase superfamily)